MFKYFIVLFLTGLLSSTVFASEAALSLLIKSEKYEQARVLLEKAIGRDQGNIALKFKLMQILAWSGKYSEALVLYDDLIVNDGNNTDYILLRAKVLLWSGDKKSAVAEFKRLFALGFKDPNVAKQYYLATYSIRPHGKGIQKLYESLLNDYPSLSGKLPRPGKGIKRTVSWTSSFVDVSTQILPWWDSSVDFRVATNNYEISLSASRYSRFGLDDSMFGGAYGVKFGKTSSWHYNVNVLKSVEGLYLAKFGMHQILRKKIDFSVLSIEQSFKRYSNLVFVSYGGGVDIYWGSHYVLSKFSMGDVGLHDRYPEASLKYGFVFDSIQLSISYAAGIELDYDGNIVENPSRTFGGGLNYRGGVLDLGFGSSLQSVANAKRTTFTISAAFKY